MTATGRGLRLAFVGDAALAATAALYLLTRTQGVAMMGYVAAAFFGLFSLQRMWFGRREFGPHHHKHVRAGLWLFLAAALLFVYALIAAFSNVPATLLIRDFRPPVVAFGLALACETASGALLLWELLGSKRHALAGVYALLGVVAAAGATVYGNVLVSRLVETYGDHFLSQEAAKAHVFDFLDQFLPAAMVAFLVTRLFVVWLLTIARKEVAVAEREGASAGLEPAATNPPS